MKIESQLSIMMISKIIKKNNSAAGGAAVTERLSGYT
jgi:hypothetical protein